jgi:hypothetical protein
LEILSEFLVLIFRAILKLLFRDLFLSGIGWFYFFVRYRNKEKRLQILQEKYDNDYSNIVRLFFVNIFYYGFGIPLIAMWVVAVVGFFGWLVILGINFFSNHF